MSSSFFTNNGGDTSSRTTIQASIDDARKLAINAINTQFTLSDGVTTGYSALHHSTNASASATSASSSAADALTYKTSANTDAGLALGYKNDSETAKTASETAQGLAENARDAAQASAASAASTVSSSAVLIAGSTMTGNLSFGDAIGIKLGDGGATGYDLRMFHDATAGVSKIEIPSDAAGGLSINTNGKGIDVTGTVTADGINTSDHVVIDNNKRIKLLNSGNGSTATEIYTDGSNNTFIAEGGGGSLTIKGQSFYIRNADNEALVTSGGSSIKLGHCPDANTSDDRLETTSSGVTVTGILTADRFSLTRTGVSTVESLGIYTDSDNDTFITENNTESDGSLKILGTTLQLRADDLTLRDRAGDDLYLKGVINGATNLYYDYSTYNTPKLATTATGVTVDGTVTADGLTLGNNEKATFNGNLEIYSAGNNSYIKEIDASGSLTLQGGTFAGKDEDEQVRISWDNDNTFLFYKNDTGSTINAGEATEILAGDSGERLRTQTGGVDVTGKLTADSLQVDTGTSGTAKITSEKDGNNFVVTSTKAASANDSPTIVIHRDATGVSDTQTGSLAFRGKTDNTTGDGTNRDYARILSKSEDATHGAEHGRLIFEVYDHDNTSVDNKLKNIMDLQSDEVKIGETNDSTNLNVTGTVTATSITSSQTAEIDTTNKTMANFKGQKVIHTGTTATYTFPDVTNADKGTTWTIVNAGTDDVTLSRGSSTTLEFSKLVASASPSLLTAITLEKGGVIECVVTAADKITVFGSGF